MLYSLLIGFMGLLMGLMISGYTFIVMQEQKKG